MSKLAHSNDATMRRIELPAAIEALGRKEARKLYWTALVEESDARWAERKTAAQQQAWRTRRNERLRDLIAGLLAGVVLGMGLAANIIEYWP